MIVILGIVLGIVNHQTICCLPNEQKSLAYLSHWNLHCIVKLNEIGQFYSMLKLIIVLEINNSIKYMLNLNSRFDSFEITHGGRQENVSLYL